ncbi:putative transcriptional regulatory protein [Vanrija pseudolonga]|uniref:Purtative transcriptional regulatory protein n=1 Tax=Vanrija pseudolonga TaxID=143232 RepID=A0AAF1BRU5_9TREE|nr:purtative transcriptional regulatory protein [Vanrija pseudolonga]WOO86264.1 purtative transcriptional regulatory protein [Vanrija pseudolonga]
MAHRQSRTPILNYHRAMSDLSDTDAPRPKRRRQRPHLSCTECRRLKMKCDRQFPCANCRRRDCAADCHRGGPTGRRTTLSPSADQVNRNLHERLAHLESILEKQGQMGTPAPGPSLLATPSTTTQVADDADHSSPLPPPADVFGNYTEASALHGITALADAIDYVDHQPLPEQHGVMETGLELPDLGDDAAMPPLESRSPAPGETEDIGTLVMFPSGRSKFLGRTAASEWLQQHDVDEAESPPSDSHIPSPAPDPGSTGWPSTAGASPLDSLKVAFPFNTATKSFSTSALLSQLPPLSDGRTLVNVYLRHFAWHYHIVSEARLWSILERAYGLHREQERVWVPADQLALLYIVFAMGTYFNLELPPDDPGVEDYLNLSQCCLAKADFITKHTLAGVQTLHIMASLKLGLDTGRNGDNAWPMFGLMLRIIQAMGLHRDGTRFGLSEEAADERRRVFWEGYSLDTIFSNKYARPGAFNPDYTDTAYPSLIPDDNAFYLIKYQLTPLFYAVMDHSMQVRTPPYSRVEEITKRISAFEINVPFEMRCRPYLCALPSLYPDPDSAVLATPPIERRNLQKAFQVFTVGIKVSECLIDLHRPYFWRALSENASDPTRSKFAPSYLTVVERCNAIVVIAASIYELFPQPAARHWWFWYHAFSAAVCMVTLVIKSPRNPLVPFGRKLVDTVIHLYTAVVGHRNSPMMAKNLAFLQTLQNRMDAKIAQTTTLGLSSDVVAEGEDDDVDLLGWTTRLIERQGTNLPRTRMQVTITQSHIACPSISAPGIESGGEQQDAPDDGWLEQLWGSLGATVESSDLENTWWSQQAWGDPSVFLLEPNSDLM